MELSHDDVKKILEIVDASEHLQEIDLVYGGFRLHVRRGGSGIAASSEERPASLPSPKPAAPVSTQAFPAKHSVEAPLGEGEIEIRSPMLGTFYLSPSPVMRRSWSSESACRPTIPYA